MSLNQKHSSGGEIFLNEQKQRGRNGGKAAGFILGHTVFKVDVMPCCF